MTRTYLRRWLIVATIAAVLLAGTIVAITTLVSRNHCTNQGGSLYGTTCFLPIPVEDWYDYRPGDRL